MGIPIVTPFGQFDSQIAAARHIFNAGYKPAFDAAFPPSKWKRTDWGPRYAAQGLSREVQDICDVIRLLIAKQAPGWTRDFDVVVQPRVEPQDIGIPARVGVTNPMGMCNSV
jgi:hypothetical protein